MKELKIKYKIIENNSSCKTHQSELDLKGHKIEDVISVLERTVRDLKMIQNKEGNE